MLSDSNGAIDDPDDAENGTLPDGGPRPSEEAEPSNDSMRMHRINPEHIAAQATLGTLLRTLGA